MTRALAVALLAAGATGVACRSAPPDETTTAPPPARSAAAPPVDHLAPGELLEGTAEAFGLRLPAGTHIEGAFVDVVYASGPAKVHPLVAYLQARLEGGDLREGDTAASFEHVTVRGGRGANAERPLLVRIATSMEGTHIEIHDETPPPVPVLPDETARWRHVGVLPNGRLADPTHLE
jgi:hypothetical protein